MSYYDTKSEIGYMQKLLSRFEILREIEKQTHDQLREEGTKHLGPRGMFKHIREESAIRNPHYSDVR